MSQFGVETQKLCPFPLYLLFKDLRAAVYIIGEACGQKLAYMRQFRFDLPMRFDKIGSVKLFSRCFSSSVKHFIDVSHNRRNISPVFPIIGGGTFHQKFPIVNNVSLMFPIISATFYRYFSSFPVEMYVTYSVQYSYSSFPENAPQFPFHASSKIFCESFRVEFTIMFECS